MNTLNLSIPPRAGPLPTGARTWAPEDVIGACRTTILKGESDFRPRGATSATSGGGGGAAREASGEARRESISIVGCHESTVYVLAPLKTVLVSNCGHSTFVVRSDDTVLPLRVSGRFAWRVMLAETNGCTANTCGLVAYGSFCAHDKQEVFPQLHAL